MSTIDTNVPAATTEEVLIDRSSISPTTARKNSLLQGTVCTLQG
jgi:hypothetical protein